MRRTFARVAGVRPLEKQVQASIVALLQTIGADVITIGRPGLRRRLCPTCKTPVHMDPGTRQTPGIPDLEAFLPLRDGEYRRVFLKVEVKRPGEKLRPEQDTYRQWCEAAGIAHVWGDLDEVIAWLLAHNYLRASQVPYYRLPKAVAV